RVANLVRLAAERRLAGEAVDELPRGFHAAAGPAALHAQVVGGFLRGRLVAVADEDVAGGDDRVEQHVELRFLVERRGGRAGDVGFGERLGLGGGRGVAAVRPHRRVRGLGRGVRGGARRRGGIGGRDAARSIAAG